MSVVWHVFGHKPIFDLMIALDEKSGDYRSQYIL